MLGEYVLYSSSLGLWETYILELCVAKCFNVSQETVF